MRIDVKPIDELGDPSAPKGSRPWLLYVANEIRKTYYDKQQTGRRLEELVHTFKELQGWQEFGYLTWEQYCAERLQARPDDIESEAAARTAATAMQARPLAPVGRPENGSNVRDYKQYESTGADYLAARIARDRPDILERMKAGEYRSVRAAAIDAGIVKPTVRYSLPSDPEAAGRYLAERVDEAWFIAVADAFYKGK